MQVEQYLKANLKNPVILKLVSKNDLLNLDAYTQEQKLAMQIQGFKAESGEVCFTEQIFIGIDDGKDLKNSILKALSLLPNGEYKCLESLNDDILVYWILAQYTYDAYKKQPSKLRVLEASQDRIPKIFSQARAVCLVRDLINAPANDMNPEALSIFMQDLAQKFDAEFNEVHGEALLDSGFAAIHAVGRASNIEPRLLELNWGKKNHPKVTLVGKGVCFDSGGLDLKPAQHMRLMKKDMAGAAHVLGLAQWCMELNLPIQLQVLIPAVENSVGSNAFRPGDILRMRNGLTVEIDNTDAEGRLILADALVYACEKHPELIIDFATLTGAARVALGTEISAFFTPDKSLSNNLLEIAQEIEDPMWELPLYAGYNEQIKSKIADLANSTDRPYGGAITAALFLKHFVNKDITWLHLDVMAWNLSNKPGKPEGGEAMGLRALGYFLQKKYQL